MTRRIAVRGTAWRSGLLLVTMLVGFSANAQEVAQYFRQNCMSCHTIGGGRLTGPDLKDVSQRKDRAWLRQFIIHPARIIDGGDPYAMKIKEEARGVVMPTIPGITPEHADALLGLIDAESKLEKSQFAGLSIGDQPFSEADVATGREIFLGVHRLTNGGPACIACHTLDGLGGLGGGRLGPDLTKVFERLQGRKNVASWLQAPATANMRPIYMSNAMTNDEIVSLVALLETTAKAPVAPGKSHEVDFFLLGMGGAVIGLVGADVVWRKRFRGVRRPMVRGVE